MFVRLRQQGRRLQASLMRTWRVAGKMHTEHIASLGSVDADVSVRERIAFWAALPGRLARLGNRVSADDHGKIYGALHACIPMVTVEEQRAVQEENAKDDEQFWEAMRDMGAASVEEHKALISSAETKIAEQAPRVAEAGERVEAAKDRLARLARGESVPGGLGKQIDVRAMSKAAGITPAMMRRARLLGNLTEAEFETLLDAAHMRKRIEAEDKAMEREARRIMRARK
jgi:hypothetical protein